MQSRDPFFQVIKNDIHAVGDYSARWLGNFQHADLSIFHQFVPPPTGGGHQFLRALWRSIEAQGLVVENNTISRATRACLFNSFNFDERRLRHLHRSSVLYVHRVDGPIDVYRGRDEGVDRQIWRISHEFADKTIFQSKYSLDKHFELGMQFNNPVICLNAVDPVIFNNQNRIPFSRDRKTRLIASSWSDNPNKGASVYTWLDQHLNWDQFDFIFIGRSPVKFQNIRMMEPISSAELAKFHRQNDIYITASRNDPCSNSLIEALSCGLPAIYLKSGGHPEIVKNAGLGFDDPEEIPELLQKVMDRFEVFQDHIEVPSIETVTSTYLKTLELIKQ